MKVLFRMNYLSLVLFLLLSSIAKGLFHIPLAVKLGSSLLPAGLAVYEYFNCHTYECCHQRWIPKNETLLKDTIKNDLFGQPFAAKVKHTGGLVIRSYFCLFIRPLFFRRVRSGWL